MLENFIYELNQIMYDEGLTDASLSRFLGVHRSTIHYFFKNSDERLNLEIFLAILELKYKDDELISKVNTLVEYIVENNIPITLHNYYVLLEYYLGFGHYHTLERLIKNHCHFSKKERLCRNHTIERDIFTKKIYIDKKSPYPKNKYFEDCFEYFTWLEHCKSDNNLIYVKVLEKKINSIKSKLITQRVLRERYILLKHYLKYANNCLDINEAYHDLEELTSNYQISSLRLLIIFHQKKNQLEYDLKDIINFNLQRRFFFLNLYILIYFNELKLNYNDVVNEIFYYIRGENYEQAIKYIDSLTFEELNKYIIILKYLLHDNETLLKELAFFVDEESHYIIHSIMLEKFKSSN